MQSAQSLGSWPPALAEAAAQRAERANWAQTACWRYRAEVSSRGRILMIHGFRGDHHGLEAIAGALPEYEIWIPDLPGYGKSAELPGRHDLSGYADWLQGLLDWLQPDALVGHSFGTQIIAAHSASLTPNQKVVLINPIVLTSMTETDLANRIARLAYRMASKLGKLGASALRSWFLVRVMSVAICKARHPLLRSWIHAQHHRHFSGYRSDRVAFEGFWAAAMGSVSSEWKARETVKTSVVAGELDSIAPINRVNEFAKRIGAPLTVLPKTGHLVHYEVPSLVAQAIRESLG